MPAEIDSLMGDPKSHIDHELIDDLAVTAQTRMAERRAQNGAVHERKARAAFRKRLSKDKARIKSLGLRLDQLGAQLQDTAKTLRKTDRWVRTIKSNDKEPADGWTYTKFWFSVVLKVALVVSGTLTVSAFLAGSPEFIGNQTKMITVACSIVLLPAWTLAVPAYFLKRRIGWLKAYIAALTLAGLLVGLVFIVTFAYRYGGEGLSMALDDIAMLGLEPSGAGESTQKLWIFEHVQAVNIGSQILMDVLLAGVTTTFLSLLATTHDLFKPKHRSENPEFATLTNEHSALQAEIREKESEKTQVEQRIGQIEEQQADFIEVLRSLADSAFLKKVDQLRAREQEAKALRQDLSRKEQEFEAAREKLNRFDQDNPALSPAVVSAGESEPSEQPN